MVRVDLAINHARHGPQVIHRILRFWKVDRRSLIHKLLRFLEVDIVQEIRRHTQEITNTLFCELCFLAPLNGYFSIHQINLKLLARS